MGPQTNERNRAIGELVSKAQQPIRDWKTAPLTISIAVAFFLATGWGLSFVTSIGDRVKSDRASAIGAHNDSERAHPGLRRELGNFRAEVRREFRALKQLLLQRKASGQWTKQNQ